MWKSERAVQASPATSSGGPCLLSVCFSAYTPIWRRQLPINPHFAVVAAVPCARWSWMPCWGSTDRTVVDNYSSNQCTAGACRPRLYYKPAVIIRRTSVAARCMDISPLGVPWTCAPSYQYLIVPNLLTPSITLTLKLTLN